MVSIKVGDTITEIKSGETSKGKWVCGIVKAEKGYDTIKAWASNPNSVDAGSPLKVKTILEGKITNRKYTDKNGAEKWATEYNLQVEFEESEPEDSHAGFSKLEPDDIPF